MRTQSGSDFEIAVLVGAVVAIVLMLTPYVSALVLPGYFGGAAAAVWFRAYRQKLPVPLKDGVKLGVYSTFLGGIAAAIIFDVVWQTWDYQIAERQNSRLLLALIGLVANSEFLELATDSLAKSARQTFEVYMLFLQFFGSVFLAGVFGTLFGIISSAAMKGWRRSA